MTLADLRIDGPARLLVVVDDAVHGQSFLLEGSLCGHEFDRDGIATADERRRRDLQVRQTEVAVRSTARTLPDEPCVGQCFETQRRQRIGLRGHDDGVLVEAGVLAGDAQRAVPQSLGTGASGRNETLDLEDLPAGILRLGARGQEPLELRWQLFPLETIPRNHERRVLAFVLDLRASVRSRVQHHVDLAPNRRRERREQPVVVTRRNGIELVVVTARTSDGQTEHASPEGRYHVVQLVVARSFELFLGQLGREHSGAEEPGRHHRQRFVGRELVASDLPLHEAVVRDVLVQRLDDEVAVVVRVRSVVVLLEPVALCEARDVQPVTCLALTEVRTREQPIDQLAVGVGVLVLHELVDFVGARRQAGKVEHRPPYQRSTIRDPARRDSLPLLPRTDEAIDRSSNPALVCHRHRPRRRRSNQRSERPEVAIRITDLLAVWRRLRIDERLVVRSTQRDPLGNPRDLLVGQRRPLLGHERITLVPKLLQQAATTRVARHHRDTLAPTGEQALARAQVEVGTDLLAAVTLQAASSDDGANVILEDITRLRHAGGVVPFGLLRHGHKTCCQQENREGVRDSYHGKDDRAMLPGRQPSCVIL